MSAVEAPSRSPFKGLAAFEDSELDALFFFGRERERQVLLANLLAARLTVLYGESGVGKSSLLGAAVVRDLRETTDAPIVVRSMWSGELGSVLDDFPGPGEGYLVFDQFEEYFLYHEADDSPLLRELPELLATTRINVLISLREDALARLDVFKARIPRVFGNQVRLEHLDAEQARAAILGPLARWRDLYDEQVDAEPALVGAVIAEVAVDGGRVEAPYLQLVIQSVWEAEREARSSVLHRATLERLGGASAIVRRQFRGALEALPAGEQDVAAAMFEHLVTPTGTKIALRVADLAEYAHVRDDDAHQVLARLTRDRVVRSVEGSDRYEIFHDVLAEPVSAWRLERRLVAERAAARRRQRQLLGVVFATLVALAIVAGLAVWAFSERGHARSQARHAKARELEALALQGLSVNANDSVRLALAAIRLEPIGAAEAVLRQALVADRLRLVRHVEAPIRDAAASPRGDRLAVAVSGKRVQILDAANRRLIREIRARRIIDAVSFADGGRRLVAATPSGRPEVWDVATGNAARVPLHATVARQPNGELTLVSVSGDLARLLPRMHGLVTAAGVVAGSIRGVDGRVHAAIFRDGRLVSLTSRIGISDVAISPDGSRVATAAQQGLTTVWDTRTGRLVWDFEDAKSGVESVAFSPDGTTLASGGEDSGVRIWDLARGTRTYLLYGHTNPVNRVAWSPNGAVVASSDVGGTVLLWRIRGAAGPGSLAATLAGGRGPVSALAFTPDSARLVTGGADGVVRVWDATPDPQLALLGRASGPALAAGWTAAGAAIGVWPHVAQAYDAHGERTKVLSLRERSTALGTSAGSPVVAVGTAGGTVEAWNTRTGEVSGAARLHAAITAAAVGAHGALVAGGGADGTITVLHAWTGRQHGAAAGMTFSGDGRLLLTGGSDGATLWDAKTGQKVQVLPTPGGVAAVALSPDGRLAAAAGRDGLGRLWFTATGKLYRVLRGHTKAIAAIAFSADGALVATAGADSQVRIWDTASGNHFAVQRRSFGPLVGVSFDPTGRWVVGAAPISAIVWNASSGRQLFYLRGHADRLTSVAFAPRTETILTASRDGTIRTYTCEVCADRGALVHLAEVRLAQTR